MAAGCHDKAGISDCKMTLFFLVYYEWILLTAILRDMTARKQDAVLLVLLLLIGSVAVAGWATSQPRHVVSAEAAWVISAAVCVMVNRAVTSRLQKLERQSVVAIAALSPKLRMVYRGMVNCGAIGALSVAACLWHISMTGPAIGGCFGLWFFGAGFFLAIERQSVRQKYAVSGPCFLEAMVSQPARQGRSILLRRKASLLQVCIGAAIVSLSLGMLTCWQTTLPLWPVFLIGYGLIPFVLLPAQSAERAAFGCMMGEPMGTVLKSMLKRLAVASCAVLFPVVLFPACLSVAVQVWAGLSCLALFLSVFVTLHYRILPKTRAEMAFGFFSALAIFCAVISPALLVVVALFRFAHLWRLNQQRLWMVVA